MTPSDILAGGTDGLVVVRSSDAEEVAAKVRKHNEDEQKLLVTSEGGQWDGSGLAKDIEDRDCKIIL